MAGAAKVGMRKTDYGLIRIAIACTVLIGHLLVLPIDILDAKRLPFVGWLDEIASLSVTYSNVCKNITPEMEAKVDAILDRWFPEYTAYELIEE